jgi:predicted O-linked N-acetylglucosamine transferase (SPINDLY family)
MNPEKLMQDAVKFHQAGRFKDAALLYEKVLKQMPSFSDGWNLHASVSISLGNFEQAEQSLNRALSIRKHARYYCTGGQLYAAKQQYTKAAEYYLKSISLEPDSVHAWMGLGNIRVMTGSLEEARECFTKVLGLQPNSLEASFNLGNLCIKCGDWESAIEWYEKSVSLNPALFQAWGNLGELYKRNKQWDKAERCLKTAIDLSPEYLPGIINITSLYLEQRRNGEAADWCNRSMQIAPKNRDVLVNQAEVASRQGSFNEAEQILRQVISLYPGDPVPFNNLGILFEKKEERDKAVQCYENALELYPDFAKAYVNLGNIFAGKGESQEASEYYSKAVELGCDSMVTGFLYHQLRNMAKWDRASSLLAIIENYLKENIPAMTPFSVNTMFDEPVKEFRYTKLWCESQKQYHISKAPVTSKIDYKQERPLKIGYLSSDLNSHAQGQILAPVFKLHDREKFSVYSYHYGKEDSSIESSILKEHSEYRVVSSMGAEQVASMIRDDGIDILIDLKGWTQGSRPEIAMLNSAPVQLRYLGQPGSTGLSCYHGILCDPKIVPMSQQQFYSEKLIHLPHCYQPGYYVREQYKGLTRKECGLPEDKIVLCGFHQIYKLEHRMLTLWLRALKSSDNTVLWLLCKNEPVKETILKLAKQQRVDETRLIFADTMPKKEHLKRLCLADLGLDTYPCNGMITTMDLLSCGVPVLTLCGETFGARTAASMLSQCECIEFIADSYQEYEQKLARYLAEPALLKKAQETLRKGEHPLFLMEQWVKDYEETLQNLYFN